MSQRRTARRRPALLLALLLAGSIVAATGASPPPPQSIEPSRSPTVLRELSSTHGTGCGAPLLAVLRTLRAGDTLRIAPGSYDIGEMSLAGPPGTSSARVTITAQDPARRPVLRGWTNFSAPRYLTVSDINFEATVPNKGAADSSRAGSVGRCRTARSSAPTPPTRCST